MQSSGIEHIKQAIAGLRNTPGLFHILTEEELDQLLPFFHLVEYKNDEILFKEGAPSESIYIVLSGKVEVKRYGGNEGKARILGTISRGSFIGESALLDEVKARSATVAALEDTRVIKIKKSDLDLILTQYPVMGVKILRELTRVLTIRLLKAVEALSQVF